MNNAQTLVAILFIVVSLDIFYTLMAIYGGYGREGNPLVAWVFRLPKWFSAPFVIVTQLGVVVLIYLHATGGWLFEITIYSTIAVRFVCWQSGFIALVRHMRRGMIK